MYTDPTGHFAKSDLELPAYAQEHIIGLTDKYYAAKTDEERIKVKNETDDYRASIRKTLKNKTFNDTPQITMSEFNKALNDNVITSEEWKKIRVIHASPNYYPSVNNENLDKYIEKNYSGKTTLTVLVNQPVPGKPDMSSERENVGHAFIRLEYYSGSRPVVLYAGFYPVGTDSKKSGGIGVAKDTTQLIIGVDGELRYDESHTWNIGKVFEISNDSALRIVNEVLPQYDNNYTWSTFGTNCVDLVQDSMEAAGLDEINGETPATFGNNIRNYWEVNDDNGRSQVSYIHQVYNGKESNDPRAVIKEVVTNTVYPNKPNSVTTPAPPSTATPTATPTR
jgi:hypothetical protein